MNRGYVSPSVMFLIFGLLGATNYMPTALFVQYKFLCKWTLKGKLECNFFITDINDLYGGHWVAAIAMSIECKIFDSSYCCYH